MDIVVRHRATRDRQEAAVAALAFVRDVLRAILDTVDYYAKAGA